MSARRDEGKPKATFKSCLASPPAPARSTVLARSPRHAPHEDTNNVIRIWDEKGGVLGGEHPPAPLLPPGGMRGDQRLGRTPAVSGAYQGLYHIWLVVAEGLCSIENICHVVTLDHLQDHGGGTEGAAPATSIPGGRNIRVGGKKMALTHLSAPSNSPFLYPSLHPRRGPRAGAHSPESSQTGGPEPDPRGGRSCDPALRSSQEPQQSTKTPFWTFEAGSWTSGLSFQPCHGPIPRVTLGKPPWPSTTLFPSAG